MSHSNYPDGCTAKDIDRAMGLIASCSQCGRDVNVEDLEDGEDVVCTRCMAADDDYDRQREDRLFRSAEDREHDRQEAEFWDKD